MDAAYHVQQLENIEQLVNLLATDPDGDPEMIRLELLRLQMHIESYLEKIENEIRAG